MAGGPSGGPRSTLPASHPGVKGQLISKSAAAQPLALPLLPPPHVLGTFNICIPGSSHYFPDQGGGCA